MQSPAPDPARPAIRPVEARFVEADGRRVLMLRDPLGLTGGDLLVEPALAPVLEAFDGSRTIAEIETALGRRAGRPLPPGLVATIARQLDEHLLLYSDRFLGALREATGGFLGSGRRPARHAGSVGYPAEPAALRDALDGIVPRRAPGSAPPPRGLIAPHIDLVRGRAGYRAAYSRLAEHAPADLYVLFGTGHKGPAAPVTGLALDWETPLGTVTTDREFVATVHDAIGAPDPLDQFLHRDEHSLEFQALFLQHLFGDGLRIAAFLTGSLPSCCGDPGHEEYLPRLRDAFARAADGRRVCFVGGADLAHIGPWFGDPLPIDATRRERLRGSELERLQHLERGEPGAFHAAIEADGNADRVCGATPIYLTALLAGGPGELLHYEQAAQPDGSQLVSFCSMLFRGAPAS
jgi:AmmeMemoRadiSam system protein B